ncbi:AAA family ATPase [Coprothermobacteraceae bacterium]|nr:AAA family ATPase [Coprothermobacteraceae bacterium]
MKRFVAFVTGPPGCGKTTLLKQVAEALRQNGVPVAGFITQEVRHGGVRVGFDIEDLSTGKRLPFASTERPTPVRFGRYWLHLDNFETIALHCFKPGFVLIIDEIGKMEFYSASFRTALVQQLHFNAVLVASLHRDFVEQFAQLGQVFYLTRDNFDEVKQELMRLIQSAIESSG